MVAGLAVVWNGICCVRNIHLGEYFVVVWKHKAVFHRSVSCPCVRRVERLKNDPITWCYVGASVNAGIQ